MRWECERGIRQPPHRLPMGQESVSPMLEHVRFLGFRAGRPVIAKHGTEPHFMGSPNNANLLDELQDMSGKVGSGEKTTSVMPRPTILPCLGYGQDALCGTDAGE